MRESGEEEEDEHTRGKVIRSGRGEKPPAMGKDSEEIRGRRGRRRVGDAPNIRNCLGGAGVTSRRNAAGRATPGGTSPKTRQVKPVKPPKTTA